MRKYNCGDFNCCDHGHHYLHSTVDNQCPLCEIERLQEESKTSTIPCCKCGGELVEFTVPNEVWNTIVRDDGCETDQEYLCLKCFAVIAAEKIERLTQDRQALLDSIEQTAKIERLQTELADANETLQLHQVNTDYEVGHMLGEKAAAKKLNGLQAIVAKLPKCWRLNEAGELVQDVSVVPGMTIWLEQKGEVVSEILEDWGHVVSAVFDYTMEIYDTRKAADAAKGTCPTCGADVCEKCGECKTAHNDDPTDETCPGTPGNPRPSECRKAAEAKGEDKPGSLDNCRVILHQRIEDWYVAASGGCDVLASSELDEIEAMVTAVRP